MTSFAMIFWKRQIKCGLFTPKNLENSKQVSLVILTLFLNIAVPLVDIYGMER